MYERFTERARLVIELAAEIANQRGHDQIDSVDVLFGMIREGDGVAGHILKNLGIDQSRFDIDIAPQQSDRERERPEEFCHQANSAVRQLVEHARQEVIWLKHDYIGTEHLLLGLCNLANSEAAELLATLGVKPGEICKETVNLLGAGSEEWKRNHPNIDFSSGIELYIFD
jgi:ATP-dependent Clp protease ATP-binding subunit ClpC